MSLSSKLNVRDVNKYWTCNLCKGYLWEATKIKECMHSFCKSCIVLYLEKNNKCPKCDILIHQSHPLNYIASDRRLQDLINKAIPQVREREHLRIKEYYAENGLPMPTEAKAQSKDLIQSKDINGNKENDVVKSSINFIGIHIRPSDDHFPPASSQYIRINPELIMKDLKKIISYFVFKTQERFKEFDIYIDGRLQGQDTSISFAYHTIWKQQVNSVYVVNYKRSKKI